MSTRHELPWPLIQSDVLSAIDACNEQRPFVSTKKVAYHIFENMDDYPSLTSGIKLMTKERTVKSRISMSLEKLGWSRFSNHSAPSGNVVYIDPRYNP